MHDLLKRRAFLQSAAALPLISTFGSRLLSAAEPATAGQKKVGELLVREASPVNLEMPLSGFNDYITPNELFYVRNHFQVPDIDPRSWTLKVEGHVEKPLSLSSADLKAMAAKTVTATLECAGNGRGLLEPKKKGVQWGIGAAGNAKWTGVPVAEVLRRAGVKSGAVDVVFVGADRGKGKEGEDLQFLRSLPLAKANDPSVLLAYQMNDRDLPNNHGFPLRAVVPGWFGVASVKWLERIIVSEKPFVSYFQSIDYSYLDRTNGIVQIQPITSLQVKSVIASPFGGEVLASDKDTIIRGTAWSGDANVTKVEISTDGGQKWSEAKLIDKPTQFGWRRWEFTWHTPSKRGEASLVCRATDAAGNQQPTRRDDDRRNYLINHLVPVKVEIR